ncbi:MAG: ATP-binding cassette domain-containing protein [Bacteroidota bacterium]
MRIELQQVSKKFNRQWLFRNISFSFKEQHSYAIVGNNGSGKSTLLQMIYGFQTISSGKIILHNGHQLLGEEQVFQHTSFVAPYLELLEDYTLKEMLQFHFQFKQIQGNLSIDDMMVLCKLENNRDKQIKLFSSGMKQRLKLALVFFSNTPLILLDEPCSNLDMQGIQWYQEMVKEVIGKRTLIIASNQKFEYDFCDDELRIEDYK